MKSRGILLPVLLLLASIPARASHMLGGEITWSCQPNGQFVFTMKLFRDCNGIQVSGPYNLATNHPLGTIPMHPVDTVEITPACNPDPGLPHISCATATGTDTGATQMFIFQSNPITLTGVPPAGGWTFSWSQCCRNTAIVNLNPNTLFLRAKMYPYHARGTSPCFDSSPDFFEPPVRVFGNGSANAFSSTAHDAELDSLATSWEYALDVGGVPATYRNGYDFDHPLPDTIQNPLNIPPVLDPATGRISFLSYTSGSFVVCLKVAAYKCGVLVAEIFRDMQVIIKSFNYLDSVAQTVNHHPEMTAPFHDNLGLPSYDTAVFAGTTLNLPLSFTDYDLTSAGMLQSIRVHTTGQGYGAGFASTTACSFPPCATVTPSPDTTTGTGVLNLLFNWTTSCTHLINDSLCGPGPTRYNFYFKASDDFCPRPGSCDFVISILVLPPPGTPEHPDISRSGDTLYCSSVATSYQWYLNDTVLPGATLSYLIPPQAGSYSVEVNAPGGCSWRSASFFFVPLSVVFPEYQLTARCYPNPAQEYLGFEASGIPGTALEVTLLTTLGQPVFTDRYELIHPEFRKIIPLDRLPSGIYLLRIRAGTAEHSLRILKVE
jgi:hypothetical protein